MIFSSKTLFVLVVVCLCLQYTTSVKLSKGTLQLTITEEHKDNIEHNIKIHEKIATTLELTQSSRVKVQTRLSFDQSEFIPQFVSFRLRHPVYQNLTEPIIAKYDNQNYVYIAQIDLGDPKQCKPYSDSYGLEIIIADDLLDKNVRYTFANSNVKFRNSLTAIPNSDLHYKTQSIIETSAPQERVDPPRLFTIFVVLTILAVDAIFVYGLKHLKVNVSLFPTSSFGFLLNLGFLVILMANLAILLKFWINWTFLETLQYLSVLILPTALVANYALVHVRKN